MMRGSFGGNQGMGGGSGGGGGGWMLRRVARAVTRTSSGIGGSGSGRVHQVQEQPFSSSTSRTTTAPTSPRKPNSSKLISLSSSSSSSTSTPLNNIPIIVPPSPSWPASFSSPPSSLCDEFEWVDGTNEDERFMGHGFYDDIVFGSVPSQDEVQSAVSALQQVFDPGLLPQLVWDKYGAMSDKDIADRISNSTGSINGVSPFGSELDWIEPSMPLGHSRMLQPHGSRTLYDTFSLLQSEPSIQRMVMSLSSDKAVWDAVLNNEVVQELRESLSGAEETFGQGISRKVTESKRNGINPDEDAESSTAATSVLMWILDSTKAKAKELLEMIMNLANHLFQPREPEKTATLAINAFEEKLKSSLLLTVVVLLIVVVARAQRS